MGKRPLADAELLKKYLQDTSHMEKLLSAFLLNIFADIEPAQVQSFLAHPPAPPPSNARVQA